VNNAFVKRRILLIGLPLIVLVIAGGLLGKANSDSKLPIGPMAPYVTRQEVFVIQDQPASMGPTLQVWVWLDAKSAAGAIPGYRSWLQDEAHWHIHHSSTNSIGATYGAEIVPDAMLDLDSNGATYLLIYTRRLSPLEALVDGLIYGRKDINSPMPTK